MHVLCKYNCVSCFIYLLTFIGQVLNFLYSLLLVYNLNGIITQMMKTPMRHILPLDDAIFLHKTTATVTFVFATVHAIAHAVRIGNDTFFPK